MEVITIPQLVALHSGRRYWEWIPLWKPLSKETTIDQEETVILSLGAACAIARTFGATQLLFSEDERTAKPC
jgi:hypothetical protein